MSKFSDQHAKRSVSSVLQGRTYEYLHDSFYLH